MEGTLKLFYGENYFKPVFGSLDYEIGETSVVTVEKGKKVVNVYCISQEEMSKEQSELFFYLWSKRSERWTFESRVKYAIHCSIEVLKYDKAAETLVALKEDARQQRENSRQQKIERLNAEMEKTSKLVQKLLDAMDSAFKRG